MLLHLQHRNFQHGRWNDTRRAYLQHLVIIINIASIQTSIVRQALFFRFEDLSGGKTEYVITIACMIGKSRMKGEKVVTTLLPYGPEKPRTGMVKDAGMNQVRYFNTTFLSFRRCLGMKKLIFRWKYSGTHRKVNSPDMFFMLISYQSMSFMFQEDFD